MLGVHQLLLLGFLYYYSDHTTPHHTIPHNTIPHHNKTKDKLNKKWKLGLSQKPKLRVYIKFKGAFIT